MLPCTSSTEPVSATDAIPSLSTMPAEDTNSAVSSSATIDCFFHCPNFIGKARQIPLLRIAGFQVPEGLDVLLNAVRTGHFRRHGPGLHLILYPIAAHHDGSGYRNDPQSRQCHPPLKGEQAQGNEHGRDEGTEQTGDEVGAVLFQYLAVCHDGAGQVGKIPLAKEGQGQLAQPLCKGQAAGAALFIGGKIGAVVLETMWSAKSAQSRQRIPPDKRCFSRS